MRIINIHKPTLLAIGLACLGLLLFTPKPAAAANPTTINFQGKVVNNTTGNVGINVADGTYSFIFRIYNTASPVTTTTCTSTATCLWEETQASVTVTSGTFQVELGSACALTSTSCNNTASGGIPANWSASSLYLTMKFNGDAAGFMSPTIHLISVPFAFNADNLGGLAATNFIQLAQGVQTDSSTTNPSIFINKTGATANIFELQKSGVDALTVNNSGSVLLGKAGTGGANGTLIFNTINASSTTITLVAASTGTSYSLTLPTTGPAVSQCLQTDSSVATQLKFGSCGGGGGTLASDYNSAGTSGNTITYTTAGAGIVIQDASTPLSGNLLTVQNNTNTFNYLSLNLASTVPHLKVFGASSSNYADIYYSGGQAFFASSSGATNVGSGSGPINISAGTASAYTITGDASSTISTTTGNITISPAAALALQGGTTASLTSATTNSITIDSGTTGQILIGAGTSNNAKTITIGPTATKTSATTYQIGVNAAGAELISIGSANASSTFALESGTAAATFFNGNTAHTIQIATGGTSAQQNVTIGSSGAAGSSVTLIGGSTLGVLVKPAAGTAAFQVQNSTNPVFTVDTSGNQTLLGKAGTGGINGQLVFNTTTASSFATTILANGSATTNTTITLPATGATGAQCLQSNSGSTATATTLLFGACSGGGTTLASAYNSAATTGNTITYTTAGAGIIIQDASTPLSGNLLTFQNNTATFNYLSLNLASSIPHLKIFGASSSNYADIFYDASSSTATFMASSGTTAVGSGSGPISITAGSAAAITITANAASTWSTSAGLLTLQGTGGASLLSTTTTAVTVDSTTTGNVVIGATNNTNAKNTAIGNNNAGSTTDIDGGTGTTGIEIGNTTTAHGIQIGSNATAANAVVLGGTNSGSTLTLEAGTGASALQIGNSSSAHGIQIGAGGAAAGSAQTVVIGSNSTTTASKITLQAGNGVTSGSFVGVNIGGSTADANQILFQLHSANNNFGSGVDVSGGCTTTLNQGAMYYSSVSNSIHACIGGSWEDVVSTAALGLQLFGVVPDTGSNPGDLAGVTGLPNGPCKVSEGGTTSTVSWTACTAYSGGRKVIVTAGTTTTAAGTSATIIFQHLCLTGTNNQPALSGIGLETANLSTVSMTAVANPILCLADIKVTNGSAVITAIYNTATYTTTDKEFASAITTAPILGGIVTQGATTPGAVAMGTALQAGSVVGVIVATTGATSTSTINAVVAINGPAWVKAITETGNAVGNTIQTTATGGYAGAFSAPVVTNVYSVLGLARTAWTSTCAINTLNCNSAVLTNVTPR